MLRYLLASSLVVLLASPALAECKAPLPANIAIDPVSTAPSPQGAAFLGRWEGTFQTTAVQICEKIAIQHINADGTVKLTIANEEAYLPGRGGGPPTVIKAQATEYVGRLEQDGLTFTTALGNQWLFKADGTASIQLRSGGTGTGRFIKQ